MGMYYDAKTKRYVSDGEESTDVRPEDLVSIQDQIKCVERELALRKNVYAKRVDTGKMSPEAARREYTSMLAVRSTLVAWRDGNFKKDHTGDSE